MDNLETIISSSPSLVRNAVKAFLKKHYCPHEFNLPDMEHDGNEDCEDCWTQALKNQD